MFFTLAPGKTVQEAGQAVLQQNNLQLVDSRETMVNGLSTLIIIADSKPDPQQQQQQQQQTPIRTISYLIQYGSTIYYMMGISAATTFNNYQSYFTNTMQSFRALTDAAKINKKPMRIRIKTVAANGTLDQALRSFKVPENKLEAHSLVNGLLRTDAVTKGMLIKVIEN